MRSPEHSSEKPAAAWQPPGRRWGRGARSVLPYLNHSVQAKLLALDIAAEDDGPVRNPVFREMAIHVRR
jgi:hypothetical protein